MIRQAGVVLAVVTALALPLMRWPRRPGDLSGLSDGYGPVTWRVYWLDLRGPLHPPEDRVTEVLRHYPQLVPPALAWFRRVGPGDTPPPVGTRYHILMFGLRRAAVQLTERWPLGFRLQTLRQHSESGWSQFQVQPGSRTLRLQIESCSRASSPLDRLAYRLGVSRLQRLTWELTLRRAARWLGGEVLGYGHRTAEFGPPAYDAFQPTAQGAKR